MNARMPDIAAPAQVLYGYAVRPPAGFGELTRIDTAAARRCEGVVDVVIRGTFVGVIAATAEQARAAAAAMQPAWATAHASLAKTAAMQRIAARGDAARALDDAGERIDALYRWPLASVRAGAHGNATAHWHNGELFIWADCGQAASLRLELAGLLDIAPEAVTLIRDADAPPEHDTFCVRQAVADAALMSHAVGRPVRTTFRAADLGPDAPRLMLQVSAALAPRPAYAISASSTPEAGQPFALTQTGTSSLYTEAGIPHGSLVPPYAIDHLDVSAAGPFGIPPDIAARAQVFAHESHLDDIAARAGVDPVQLRLGWLDDAQGSALIERVAAQAGWQGPLNGTAATDAGAVRRGRGFAYASVVDMESDRPGRTWSAWVADVEVDGRTGDISVTRVTVGYERDNPAPGDDTFAKSLPDAAASAMRRLTASGTQHDDWGHRADADASGTLAPYAPAHGVIDPQSVDIVGRLEGGAAAMLPAAAALANAIHDATGVRLREPPFSAGRIRQVLEEKAGTGTPAEKAGRKRRFAMKVLAPLTALAGLCATVLPWRAPIAPVAPPGAGFYSAATIERGRLVAAAGDCAVCHTAPGGAPNAGGLALQTPFGTVYSTNITPDPESGIGTWSFAAFERAMREGIHRDGHRLYPAFPYTAFAKVSDADMHALYAYLMAAEPVSSHPPQTRLNFPFNVRPLLGGWNLLYHRNAQYVPDPARSALWNRGAYLAEGLGHCSACHSPRNALGAEKGGRHYLTGGEAEGWEAPALTALSKAPLPWTEDDLFQYLRTGFAPRHGAAAGPMAPVVESLRELPESDVRAIAHYVASFSAGADAAGTVPRIEEVEARSATAALRLTGTTDRLYQTACAVCHDNSAGVPQFGVKPSLALNTNLHGTRPDNVIQAVLHGIAAPPHPDIGHMPGFADSLDDAQVTQLVHYLRARFAPDKPAWQDVEAAVARARGNAGH